MPALYLGNSIEQWALFSGGVLAAVIAGKILSFLINQHFKQWASRTHTELDDVVLGAFEKPLMLGLLALGILLGQGFLSIEPELESALRKTGGIIATFAVAWFLVNLVDGFVRKVLSKLVSKTSSKLDDQLLPIISKSLKVIIVILAVIMVSGTFLGIDVTGPLVGLGIGGVAIALAAQATLSDVFGGVSIFTSKPFQIGDTIIVDDWMGTVEEVGLRHTRIRNLENRVVTYPNSKLAASVIENVSSSPKRRIVLNLGLTYHTPVKKIGQAKQIITQIIEKNPQCEKPPALVSFSEFKDFSLNLQVVYFITDLENWMQIRGEINEQIKSEFEKAKIEFAFPTQTVYLEKQSIKK